MTNEEVIENFIAGHICSGGNLTSTGDKLYSYQTCIAEYTPKGLVVNKTKYSVTTSKHVGMLLRKLPYITGIKSVENIPRGTKKLWIETKDS